MGDVIDLTEDSPPRRVGSKKRVLPAQADVINLLDDDEEEAGGAAHGA
jgi:hypothetical protein